MISKPDISMVTEDGYPSRTAFDLGGREVFTVVATYREDGYVSPTQADVLAAVLRDYFASPRFAADWKRIDAARDAADAGGERIEG